MDFQILLSIIPSVLVGTVLLVFEYLTPWFARSLQAHAPSSPTAATGQSTSFDRQSIITLVKQLSYMYDLDLVHHKDYGPESVDVAKVIIWKLDKAGQSHLRATLEVLGDEKRRNQYFEVICTPDGEIGEVYRLRQLPQEPKLKPLALTSPLSSVLISVFWMLGSGITIGILWGARVLSEMYRAAGLDMYWDSLLMTILIVAQTALLAPILFTFLVRTLQKLGAKVEPISAGCIAFTFWPFGTLLLGTYPSAIMALIDSYIPQRLEFQHLFLEYKTSAASSIVWATDVSLVIFFSGLVLGLGILVGRCVRYLVENPGVARGIVLTAAGLGLMAYVISHPTAVLSLIVYFVVAGIVVLVIFGFVGNIIIERVSRRRR